MPRSHKTKPFAIKFLLKTISRVERSYALKSDPPIATQCICHHDLTNWIEKHLGFWRCCVDLFCRQIPTRTVRRLLSIFSCELARHGIFPAKIFFVDEKFFKELVDL